MPKKLFQKGNPGRPKGAKGKKTLVLEKIYQKCLEKGFHPADLLIEVVTDPEMPITMRIENAWKLVEYMEGKQPESKPIVPATPSDSVENAKEIMAELEALSHPIDPATQEIPKP